MGNNYKIQSIFLVVFVLPNLVLGQLTNTTAADQTSLYYDALHQILSEHAQDINDHVVIVEAKSKIALPNFIDNFEILNSTSEVIYASKAKRRLAREYQTIVARPLRLYIRKLFVDQTYVKFSVILMQGKYETRKKYDLSLFGDGLWIFSYGLNEERSYYTLIETERGIIL